MEFEGKRTLKCPPVLKYEDINVDVNGIPPYTGYKNMPMAEDKAPLLLTAGNISGSTRGGNRDVHIKQSHIASHVDMKPSARQVFEGGSQLAWETTISALLC